MLSLPWRPQTLAHSRFAACPQASQERCHCPLYEAAEHLHPGLLEHDTPQLLARLLRTLRRHCELLENGPAQLQGLQPQRPRH